MDGFHGMNLRGNGENLRLALFAVCAVMVLALGCVQETSPAGYKNITRAQMDGMMQEGDVFLVDVHIPEVDEHIGGTDAFIPYDEIESSLDSLPEDKDARIVVYCRSGRMSAIAAQTLVESGYTNVYNVEEGVAEYQLAKQPPAPGPEEDAAEPEATPDNESVNELIETVIPAEGIDLGVRWDDVGPMTVDSGAIDMDKLEAIMQRNGRPLTGFQREVLINGTDETIRIDSENSYFLLNFFWAFGLVNENPVLTNGSMAENPSVVPKLASTGGWPLGNVSGPALFASKMLVNLSEEQQDIVWEVANGTYRPCCNNPTSFPDCNHGMAALGLAEWMAYQNASADEIYDALLAANSYWFPQTYIETAAYLESQNISWGSVDAKEILSAEYSSAGGYYNTKQKLKDSPQIKIGGGGCGV